MLPGGDQVLPGGDHDEKSVGWSDDSAPFSSDKIRAKILDLGYGGARRALHNLSPKSLLGFYQRQSQMTGGRKLDLTILPPRRG